MNAKKRNYILVSAGVLCMVVAAMLSYTFKGEFGKDTVGVATVQMMDDTIEPSQAKTITEPQRVTSTPSLPSEWIVHVSGAVKKPGVYKVPCDSRIYTALEAAGGFSEKADTDAVNLAAKLQDGVQIHFPSRNDSAHSSPPATSAAATTPAIQTQRGMQTQSANSDNGAHSSVLNKVNINTATQAELETLKGIGPKTAQAIIQYRADKGNFARIEDLMLVKGIGAKKFESLKGMITVGK